jgi:hypothetical protein
MSIDVYFSARRATPLTPAEHSTVHGIIERANAGRHDEWCAAYDDPKYPDPDVGQLGRFDFSDLTRTWWANKKPPYLFSGSAQMPLVDAWQIVLPLLECWCDAFSEIRRSTDAESWSAHMDDFDFDWDSGARRYVLPAALTSAKYRASVEFSLGRRL